ncbi:hypothetical protein Leryth_019315 [Lithospermum erythrorhizon]|nr:hypothetical protein Leryth_019315 [Lithospermum erythrorhizon]
MTDEDDNKLESNHATNTHMGSHHLQDCEHNTEMYNCEMIGFQNKNHLQNQQNETGSLVWKTFPGNNIYHGDVGPSSSNKAMNHEDQFYHHTMMVPDHHPSSSIFSSNIEGNERTSQGLSLSLSASNDQFYHDDMRFVADGFNVQSQQHSMNMMQDGFLGKAKSLNYSNVSGQQFQIRNSKYLVPVQELLSEFCNHGTEQTDLSSSKTNPVKKNTGEMQDDNYLKEQSPLFSLDLLELQKRKAKLIQMLEEVDRRSKKDILTFASKHKAVGECPDGFSRNYKRRKHWCYEFSIKCNREQQNKRPFNKWVLWRAILGDLKEAYLRDSSLCLVSFGLNTFFIRYPSDVDKHILARQTGLSRSQVSNWFINARVRLWKPMVEQMYLEELKEQENNNLPDSMDAQTGVNLQLDDGSRNVNFSNKQNHNHLLDDDHKPSLDQLVRIDSECLSSIINTNMDENKNDGKNGKSILQQEPEHHQPNKNLSGAMEFDFTLYNHHHSTTNEIHFGDNENAHHNHQQNYGGSGNGNGISLTLGLQQHGGSGVSLAFPSASHQSSLFYSRDHIEDCPQVPQYSLLDNHESQNLLYRNLMGAQLLHDLAG